MRQCVKRVSSSEPAGSIGTLARFLYGTARKKMETDNRHMRMPFQNSSIIL